MLNKIATVNKALVAALGTILTAAAPAITDAVSEWVAGVVGIVITTGATYLVPNKPQEG